MSILHSCDELTSQWLTAALRGSGALPDGEVRAATSTPVGTGQMGDSFRVRLDYADGAAAGPASVILKVASADERSRATGLALRAFEVEVRFYLEVAGAVAARVPGCHLAEVDADTGWFTLLLEDMAPATQGDQLDGCTATEAALAMDQLSSLHAPLWEDPQLAALGWLNRQTPASAEFTAGLVSSLWPGFLERYGALLSRAEVGICGRLVDRLGPYLADRSGPMTVVHGDYRPDNLLFGDPAAGAAAPLTVVDWQTAVWGPPMVDVSYFLACALAQPQERAALEGDLVRRYHDGLVGRGVTGYDWEECWRDYRRCSFTALVMAIASSMLVQQTERGDQMFVTTVRRACAQIEHLDALELLP